MEREKNLSDRVIEDILRELKSDDVLGHIGTRPHIIAEIQNVSNEALTQVCSFVAARVLADSFLPQDYVRTFRIIEHYGPRADVQKQIANGLYGTRRGMGKSFITAYPLETMDKDGV